MRRPESRGGKRRCAERMGDSASASFGSGASAVVGLEVEGREREAYSAGESVRESMSADGEWRGKGGSWPGK